MTDKLNRREFVKATGAAAAAGAAGAVLPSARAQKKAAAATYKPLRKVNRFSEDGELKEVIFGTMEGFRLPAYNPIFDFAGPKIVDLLKRAGGEMFAEAEPEWNKRVTDSMERVVTVEWLIVKEIDEASPEQIRRINLLEGDNARRVQARYGRVVEH